MQASQINPGGCMLEFCALQIPTAGLTLSLVSAAMAYFISQNLMFDILIITAIMYFFQGFAVLHSVIVSKGKKMSLLLPAYFLLLVAPQIGLVGFALLGLLDIFMNFRKPPKATHN
jgi:hypothetical protein